MRKLILVLAALLLVALPPLVACGGDGEEPTLTAKFIVNSTDDAVDATPGDGVAETAPGNGVTTLRAAIMEANNLAGRVAITLPPGTYALSIAGRGEDAAATGDLDIADDLAIIGAGADTTILDGGDLDRVFDILPGSTVDITGVAVRNGNPGPVSSGGGIDNRGTLEIADTTVTGNSASLGGGISNGKGSTLTLSGSTVTGNSAPDDADILNIDGTVVGYVPTDAGNHQPGPFATTATVPLYESKVYDLWWGAMQSIYDVPSAQRDFITRQVQEVMEEGQKVIRCTYGPSDPVKQVGFLTYTFWYKDVPDNIIDMLSSAPSGTHPMWRLGLNSVTACPESPELAQEVERSGMVR